MATWTLVFLAFFSSSALALANPAGNDEDLVKNVFKVLDRDVVVIFDGHLRTDSDTQQLVEGVAGAGGATGAPILTRIVPVGEEAPSEEVADVADVAEEGERCGGIFFLLDERAAQVFSREIRATAVRACYDKPRVAVSPLLGGASEPASDRKLNLKVATARELDNLIKEECPLFPAIPLSGQTVRVVYDSWRPAFYFEERGSEIVFDGLFYQVITIVAQRLNLTLEFVPNETGSWGKRLPDGSWTGMINMTIEREADIVTAGFYTNTERAKVVDLSVGVFSLDSQLFTRRDSRSKVSLINYFHEFSTRNWILIAATATCLMFALYASTRILGPKGRSRVHSVIVLRNLLYQGGSFHSKRLSMRSLLFVNLLFASVIALSYRSCMNSFLTITIPVLAVKSMEDAAEKGYKLTFWGGGATEQQLENSPAGSAEQKLYQRSTGDDNARKHSYKDLIANMVRYEDYVLISEASALPKLPCEIVQVPKYVFITSSVVFVFAKGSALTGPFNREIIRLKQQGVVDRLVARYFEETPRDECEVAGTATSLGFVHVFAPFGMLAIGLTLALGLGLIERMSLKSGRLEVPTTTDQELSVLESN